MQRRPTVTILIPAHNEEKTVSQCINSCLYQTDPPEAIVVVDDGSTDGTGAILSTFTDPRIRIITKAECTGAKSRAQEVGMKQVQTDIVITTDADTLLNKNFVHVVRSRFEEDAHIAAMSGSVVSMPYNYLTALRDIEYVLGRDIFKPAQYLLGFLHIISGCAGAFRTSLFHEGVLTFDHDTLTEDLDFTYKLHNAGLAVVFEPRAISYTQDPHTLSSYINQLRRWHGGTWQNIRKHWRVMRFPGAGLIAALVYGESLMFFLSILTLFFIDQQIAITFFLWFCVTVLFLGLYAAYRRGRLDLFFFSPLLVPITAVNAYVFVEQFCTHVLFFQTYLNWQSPQRRDGSNFSTQQL